MEEIEMPHATMEEQTRLVLLGEGRTAELRRCPAPIVLDGCEHCFRFDEPEGRGVFAFDPDGREVLDVHLEEIRDLPGLLRLFREFASQGIDDVKTSGVMRAASQDDIATEPPPARRSMARS
jgi:hypothetical protein